MYISSRTLVKEDLVHRYTQENKEMMPKSHQREECPVQERKKPLLDHKDPWS